MNCFQTFSEALQKQSIQRSPYTFQAAGINAPPYRAHSRPDQFQEILQNPQVSAVYDTESLHSKYKIVCYYESWAISRPGSGSFRVNDYNPLLCTHLIYAFAKIDEPSYTIKSLDEYVDIQSGKYIFKS